MSTRLLKVGFCARRRDWPWAEIRGVVAAVSEAADADLDSFLLWVSLNDYAPFVHLMAGGAEVVLHRKCCGQRPVVQRYVFDRREAMFRRSGDDETSPTDLEPEAEEDQPAEGWDDPEADGGEMA